MKKSLELLDKAEANYIQAISDIVAVNAKLRDFASGVQKMVLTDSAEHKEWIKKQREGAYTAAGAVSVGLIVADILGCLGICSSVGNLISWGSTVAATESSIAA